MADEVPESSKAKKAPLTAVGKSLFVTFSLLLVLALTVVFTGHSVISTVVFLAAAASAVVGGYFSYVAIANEHR